MTCPIEITEIIVEILTMAIVRIRNGRWTDANGRSMIEADHIHNLPSLLTRYSPDLLQYYWEVERPSYMSQVSKSDWKLFESSWINLARFIPGETERLKTG